MQLRLCLPFVISVAFGLCSHSTTLSHLNICKVRRQYQRATVQKEIKRPQATPFQTTPKHRMIKFNDHTPKFIRHMYSHNQEGEMLKGCSSRMNLKRSKTFICSLATGSGDFASATLSFTVQGISHLSPRICAQWGAFKLTRKNEAFCNEPCQDPFVVVTHLLPVSCRATKGLFVLGLVQALDKTRQN